MTEGENNMSKWLLNNAPQLKGKKILYLCMEMLFPEMKEDGRNANFKGGLGILAAGTMEGFNSISLEAVAAVPLYNSGWVQTIENNRQKIIIKKVDYSKEPIEEVRNTDGAPLILNVDFDGTSYPLKVYKIIRGGIPVYLFFNEEVFDILYTDDRLKRLRQEVFIGKAVPLLMDSIKLDIDFIHLNEAHTVIAACNIKEREKYSKILILFTTHTPAPEGMEKFPLNWFEKLDLHPKYLPLFQNGDVLDFTFAALKISSLTNAVSQEHAEVTKNMFPDFKDKIIGITNGSSLRWQSPEIRNKENITPEKLFNTHLIHKKEALNDASIRLKKYYDIDVVFDLNKPTVGLSRRIAGYKQLYPMFKDITHPVCAPREEKVNTPLGKLDGLGLQVFISGIAHPNDDERKEWVRHFIEWTLSDKLKGKFSFLPGYGEELLQHGARGYDIWVSCPEKKMEGCGTSDQRAALNGHLNISTATGGAIEYLKELDIETLSGEALFIEPYEPLALYNKLKTASNLIYDHIDDYKKIMFNSYNAGMKMTIDRMAESYVANFYVPALEMVE